MEFEIVDASVIELPKTLTNFEISGELEFEVIDADEVIVTERKKKIEAFFPYGSYSKERTYRTYWEDNDQDFLMSLVSVKVQRMNRKKQEVILDDIREFRLLKKVAREQLVESFTNVGYNFSVYGEE
jgi:tRNA isopentenyl-2-thiomethyl-A-37 hydroxylase MiaE